MEETRNSRSWQGFIDEARTNAREVFVTRPRHWWEQTRGKLRNLPQTNFELGCRFADRGLWKDATFRFRVVLYLSPNYPGARFNLGCCYFRLGKLKEAREALRKTLAQTPDNRDAIYMLTAIDASAVPAHLRPTRMPLSMVTQFFGQMAPNYDAIELQNQYQGGQLVFDAVRPLVNTPSVVLVDLGRGTGIAARPWRVQAGEIIGVDCTRAMEAAAASTAFNGVKTFDRVIDADIGAPLDSIPVGTVDLAICINTASYVGDLSGLVQNVATLLKPGGLFAITTEAYTGPSGFGLLADTGRFGHAPEYVRNQFSARGFTIAREMRVNLYPDTAAQLQVFAKS